MQIPQRLQTLKGNQHVCLAFLHNGFRHLFSISHKGYHTAAALGHAVHLGQLHVIARADCKLSKYAAGKKGSLAAYAYYHNIL